MPFAREHGTPSLQVRRAPAAGDVHVHFFGAGAFSFGEIALQDGDVMEIASKALASPPKRGTHRSYRTNSLFDVLPCKTRDLSLASQSLWCSRRVIPIHI